MRLLIHWLITSLTILAIPNLISGVTVDGFSAALAAAAVLGIFNALLKPILILFTLPLTVLTLGFFLLVINAVLFKWVGVLVSGFHVGSFTAAFFSSLLVSTVSWLMSLSFQTQGGRRVVVVRDISNGPGPRMKDVN